ncbi:MAG TPA: 2-oxoacid:acceptor oxidoreductase subunit alpha [Negativicutes bacterium]|nr:2-oxoacid:acceptor oxidoreductase subunit alpha [Negativicutes bacterium]
MGKRDFVVLFGGEAGYGVMSAGMMIAKAAVRNSMQAVVVNEYPSLIKGGLNNCLVRISDSPLTSFEETPDILGAVSQQAYELNVAKVRPGGVVFHDVGVKTDKVLPPAGVTLVPVQLVQTGSADMAKVMANSAVMGAFCALTDFSAEAVKAAITGEFANPVVQTKNLEIFEHTWQTVKAAQGAAGVKFPFALQPSPSPRMLLTGTDAVAMGALQAGCRFAAGYPMTPATGVLVYLADHAVEYGVVFKQAEDEIAAVNMLIGAGFAGVRALGATSGGGFSLMTEAVGFAAIAEVPLVILMAQRGGPSTGLPTRTMQADLNQVLYASQGEFARVIVAPGDVEECFTETFRAFNLAEKYQVPCFILTDKYLADSSVTQPFFDTKEMKIERGKLVDEAWLASHAPYLRYRLTEDGVSERAIPGQVGGRHVATSYTHGEDGFYSSGHKEYAANEQEITAAGIDKSFAKLPHILAEVPGIKLHGPAQADLTLIAWGSTKGAALEAMELAKEKGISVNLLQILYAAPFPAASVMEVLTKAKRTLLIEGNHTAQMGVLLRANTGFAADAQYLKYDSKPFTPSGIVRKIQEVMSK